MASASGFRLSYCLVIMYIISFNKSAASSSRLVVTFHTREMAQQDYSIPGEINVVKQYGRRLVLNFGRDVNITEDSEVIRGFIDSTLIERIEIDEIVSTFEGGLDGEKPHLRSEYSAQGSSLYYDYVQWNLWTTYTYSIHAQYLWDHSYGSSNVVVAVLDSGISTQGKTFLNNYVKGYDFVSSDISNDGDGRDDDETDPGTAGTGCETSSWHGTKVSSIIAAKHDSLINGIAPNCSLMNVRVMGKCTTGWSTDVADGIVWAVGGEISGVARNPKPAKIINLSLSGKSSCPDHVRSAINQAVASGAIIVVSAGNKNEDSTLYFPCNCGNVIVVAASSWTGGLTSYSNYGPLVDIAAPGGDSQAYISVISETSMASEAGTSFAAPQIAGILSIWVHLITLFPIDTNKAKKLLSSSSTPLETACKASSGCGPGIVKAQLKHDKFVSFCNENNIKLFLNTTLWQYGIENKCCNECKKSVSCDKTCTLDDNYCRKQCLEPCAVGQCRGLCSSGNSNLHICKACQVCMPGEYKTMGCDRFSNSECSQCSANTFSTTKDAESCTPCESAVNSPGMYRTGCGMGSAGTLQMCTNYRLYLNDNGVSQNLKNQVLLCGRARGQFQTLTDLKFAISEIASLIPFSSNPLCVMEVGTADGGGTTVALYDALRQHCEHSGQSFKIYSYESIPQLADSAQLKWNEFSNVKIINEIVVDERFLREYVIDHVEGPDINTFPGKPFYESLYSSIPTRIKSRDLGQFWVTKPSCKLDMVLIDSTRFAHAGIVQTILDSGLSTNSTIFVIENDFWTLGANNETKLRDERNILEYYWHLDNLMSASSIIGEQWPWLFFTIYGNSSVEQVRDVLIDKFTSSIWTRIG